MPNQYKILAGLLGLALAFASGYWKGAQQTQLRADLANAQATAQAQQVLLSKQAEILTQERAAHNASLEAGTVLSKQLADKNKAYNSLKEQLHHAQAIIDRDNHITAGFVRYLDAAASSTTVPAIPDTTGQPDAESAAVAASAVLKSVTGNYEACTGYIVQLNTLIDWVNSQEKIHNGNKESSRNK